MNFGSNTPRDKRKRPVSWAFLGHLRPPIGLVTRPSASRGAPRSRRPATMRVRTVRMRWRPRIVMETGAETGWPTASHRPPVRAYRGPVVAPPPDDADRWSDDEWLAWLEQVDAQTPPEPEGRPVRPRRSLPTQMLGAAMLGLHRVIYGDAEPDVQIVVDADGEPPDPEQLEVHLDPDDPDASTVTVRPWVDGH